MDKDFIFSSQGLGDGSQSVPSAPSQQNNSWVKNDKEAVEDDYWRRDDTKGESFKRLEREPFKKPGAKNVKQDKSNSGLFAKYSGGVKRDIVHFFLGKGKWTDFKDNKMYQNELSDLRDKYFSKDKETKSSKGEIITPIQLQKIKRQINIDARNSVYQGGKMPQAYKTFIDIVNKL